MGTTSARSPPTAIVRTSSATRFRPPPGAGRGADGDVRAARERAGRGPRDRANSRASGRERAPPGDRTTPLTCAWLCGSLGFEVAPESVVVFENSAVWRSTGSPQVARSIDVGFVRPVSAGADTCRPSSAAALGRFVMGGPTFESRPGLAPVANSLPQLETGRRSRPRVVEAVFASCSRRV
jgi:hypothetical protein